MRDSKKKNVKTILNDIFVADKKDLKSFFNEAVNYGMAFLVETGQRNRTQLNESQRSYIEGKLQQQCNLAFDRFAHHFEECSIDDEASFDAYYQYPVLLRYQQEQAIQKDLAPQSFDEETAIIGQLALESIYQTAKAKLP